MEKGKHEPRFTVPQVLATNMVLPFVARLVWENEHRESVLDQLQRVLWAAGELDDVRNAVNQLVAELIEDACTALCLHTPFEMDDYLGDIYDRVHRMLDPDLQRVLRIPLTYVAIFTNGESEIFGVGDPGVPLTLTEDEIFGLIEADLDERLGSISASCEDWGPMRSIVVWNDTGAAPYLKLRRKY